jgi:hypothetical protein
MSLNLNKNALIRSLVAGIISHPVWQTTAWPNGSNITHEGAPQLLAGRGGIAYGLHAGDRVYGWAADHIEPGASTTNPENGEREAYFAFCCMGNRVEVIGGKAEGALGYVLAKHAFSSVIVDFLDKDMEKMRLKDPVQVYVYGTGLELPGYPDILLNSIDPGCFEAMNITENHGKLQIPVAGIVPAELMGSGFGYNRPMGDIDFMASDWNAVKEYGLDDLRFGDLVLIRDIDSRFGASYRRGAASVGIIAHGDSKSSGHGPGITTFMSSAKPLLEPVLDKNSNIKKYHDKAYGPLKAPGDR